MSAMNFNTTNLTYRQLMGNGLIYTVPRFQRDYSWTEVEWEDLWMDIENTLLPEGESAHYMGYLVLQSSDNKNFDIIDGQQRLTTISLIILAVLKNLQFLIDKEVDSDNNRQRQNQLRNSFIGYLDPVTLIAKSKMTLNRNNDVLYQRYLVPLEKMPQRGLKATEHLMRKAFEWFVKKIQEIHGGSESGADLARIIEALSDKLFFTVITVTDELNAFKVFETLNARGVRLSSTDLLKNYLFSIVYFESNEEREMNELDNRWEALTGKLGNENLPDFLRTHWNSRKQFVRHAELFKTIRGQIHTRGDVFSLMRAIEEDADIYTALSSPEDALWSVKQREYISELRMFNVRQLYPLLLAAYKMLSPEDFTSLLRICSIISFRYNVIGGLAANEQERVYTSVAERISKGEFTDLSSVIRELRTIYPTDEQFRSAFAEKQLKTTQSRNKRIVRYILFCIEKQMSGQAYDIDSDTYSIEHILPEHPDESWKQFTDYDMEQFVYRIGNMTTLRTGVNRSIGNSSFEEKRAAYSESDLSITRKIAEENAEWNTERIAVRQRWLAEQAKAIWKVSQLS